MKKLLIKFIKRQLLFTKAKNIRFPLQFIRITGYLAIF